MPTYDYRCSKGHRYEKREPFGSPPEQPCDRCGKTAKRVIHAPPIVFKGSGWYSTDSRSGSSSSSSSSDGSSSDTSEKTKAREAATAERQAKSAERKAKSSSSSKSGSSSDTPSSGSKPE